jgi:membrane protease YdiL (CAAX protease family)
MNHANELVAEVNVPVARSSGNGDLPSIRWTDDLKSALLLAGAFALAAAFTVPGLLRVLPPEAQALPLPLPIFCVVLAVQLTVVYGLLGLAGFRLARARGREPAPLLSGLWTTPRAIGRGAAARMLVSLSIGLACGVCLVGAVTTISHWLPGTLPRTLHPPGIGVATLASLAGSLGEEILFRLFLLSLLLRVLPVGRVGTSAAIAVSALAFGAAHAPAFALLFGGWREVPPVAWAWLIGLNGLCGTTYAAIFLRHGILGTVLAHLGTDLVWHAASQLL